jgi:hypothetical protein
MQAIKQRLHPGGTTGASGTQSGQGGAAVGNRVICNIQNLQLAPMQVLPTALGGSKFHPYLAIYNRERDVAVSAKTRTHKEAVGIAGPINFNETHTFQAHPESNIRIALWDDNLIKDKEVAEGFLPYQQLISGMPVQCPLFPVSSKFNLTGNFGSGYSGGGYGSGMGSGSGAAGSTGTLGGSQGGAYTAGSSTIAPGTQPLAIVTLMGRLENPSLATGGGVGATSAGTTGMGMGGGAMMGQPAQVLPGGMTAVDPEGLGQGRQVSFDLLRPFHLFILACYHHRPLLLSLSFLLQAQGAGTAYPKAGVTTGTADAPRGGIGPGAGQASLTTLAGE